MSSVQSSLPGIQIIFLNSLMFNSRISCWNAKCALFCFLKTAILLYIVSVYILLYIVSMCSYRIPDDSVKLALFNLSIQVDQHKQTLDFSYPNHSENTQMDDLLLNLNCIGKILWTWNLGHVTFTSSAACVMRACPCAKSCLCAAGDRTFFTLCKLNI